MSVSHECEPCENSVADQGAVAGIHSSEPKNNEGAHWWCGMVQYGMVWYGMVWYGKCRFI